MCVCMCVYIFIYLYRKIDLFLLICESVLINFPMNQSNFF